LEDLPNFSSNVFLSCGDGIGDLVRVDVDQVEVFFGFRHEFFWEVAEGGVLVAGGLTVAKLFVGEARCLVETPL